MVQVPVFEAVEKVQASPGVERWVSYVDMVALTGVDSRTDGDGGIE
jgi:hypothetical protein